MPHWRSRGGENGAGGGSSGTSLSFTGHVQSANDSKSVLHCILQYLATTLFRWPCGRRPYPTGRGGLTLRPSPPGLPPPRGPLLTCIPIPTADSQGQVLTEWAKSRWGKWCRTGPTGAEVRAQGWSGQRGTALRRASWKRGAEEPAVSGTLQEDKTRKVEAGGRDVCRGNGLKQGPGVLLTCLGAVGGGHGWMQVGAWMPRPSLPTW